MPTKVSVSLLPFRYSPINAAGLANKSTLSNLGLAAFTSALAKRTNAGTEELFALCQRA